LREEEREERKEVKDGGRGDNPDDNMSVVRVEREGRARRVGWEMRWSLNRSMGWWERMREEWR